MAARKAEQYASTSPAATPRRSGARVRVDGRGLPRGATPVIRRLAVQRVARGERPRDVMEGLGLCRTSIYRWLRAARANGMSALEPRRHRGPSPVVSDAQAAVLRRLVVGRSPSDHRLPGRLWTRSAVRTLLQRRLSLTLSLPAVARLLKRAGLHPSVKTLSADDLPRRETCGLLFAVDGRGAFLCVPFAGQGPGLSLSEAASFLAERADRRVDLVGVRSA